MKKILLAAAIFAVASINSFGAACANGLLSAQPLYSIGGTCTVGNWTLSTFGLFNAGGLGYSGTVNENDIFVTFNSFTGGSGEEAFSVSFSDAAGGNNYFSATNGAQNQTQNWRTIFVIESGPAVQQVTSSLENANVTTGSGANGQITLQKVINNATNPNSVTTMGDTTLLAVPGTLIPGSSANVAIALPNSVTRLGVVDNYQISSGNNGTSSLTSYTNSFYAAAPQTGVPEPMTFVLMGAGLVGIAALRRRNS